MKNFLKLFFLACLGVTVFLSLRPHEYVSPSPWPTVRPETPSVPAKVSEVTGTSTNRSNSCLYPITQREAGARYINEQYGFALYFDAAWKQYQAMLTPLSGVSGAVTIDIRIPNPGTAVPTNADYRTALVIIVVPTSAAGANFLLPAGDATIHGPIPSYLGRNGDYYFAYSPSDDPPQLDAYNCEIRATIASFRILGQ
jgi:hypothetical protein